MLFISTPATAKKIDKSRLSELDSSTLVDLIKVLLHTTKNTFILLKICVRYVIRTYIFDTLGLHEWKPRLKEREWGSIFSTGYAIKGPRTSMQGKRAATKEIRGS